mmetsp:Transcript_23924/g.60527  ORF Transcript_23924/g.60527 Transcript_23924/m.60527 type:complete len:249 (+) Transcript_23924:2833-3579(+)
MNVRRVPCQSKGDFGRGRGGGLGGMGALLEEVLSRKGTLAGMTKDCPQKFPHRKKLPRQLRLFPPSSLKQGEHHAFHLHSPNPTGSGPSHPVLVHRGGKKREEGRWGRKGSRRRTGRSHRPLQDLTLSGNWILSLDSLFGASSTRRKGGSLGHTGTCAVFLRGEELPGPDPLLGGMIDVASRTFRRTGFSFVVLYVLCVFLVFLVFLVLLVCVYAIRAQPRRLETVGIRVFPSRTSRRERGRETRATS